ncbi:MAG: hypothetical protein HKM05_00835 [Spirochaetales bacterium]|nr:hypothetical protein [Spirochaetales bacterium]
MSDEPKEELNIMSLFILIWEKKTLLIVLTIVFTILGIVFAFVWPKTYDAEATVFPISSRSSSSSLSQYAGLAAMAGIALPGSAGNEASETVSALLDSRLLAEKVVADLDLVKKLNPQGFSKKMTPNEEFEATAVALKKDIKSKKDPLTGVITIIVGLHDPYLAKEVANDTVGVLDKLLMDKNLTTTKKRIENLEHQIASQRIKLDDYQNQMAEFQRQTSMIDPKAQSSQAVGAYTSLIQQKMNLELQLATAQALFSSDNPKVAILKIQIKNLEKQIEMLKNQVGDGLPSLKQAPENLIRYQNLVTQLEIATKLYAGLLADLEQTKLQNDKDQVYITILDKALLPKFGKPSKAIIIAISFVLGIFVSILIIFGQNTFEKSKKARS